MGCLATTGFTLPCGKPTGGIQEIFIANWDDVVNNVVLGASGNLEEFVESTTLYRYVLDAQSASFTCSINFNADNQSMYYTHTVTMKRRTLTQEFLNELENLGQGKFVIFARDEENQIWMLGYERGLDLSGGTGITSGQAMSDMKGVDLQFTGQSKRVIKEVKAYDPSAENPFDNITNAVVSPSY